MLYEVITDGDAPIVGSLERLAVRLAELSQIDGALGGAQELLNSAAIQADEALHALRSYRDRLDLDPEQLGELDTRIATVTDMARKHRVAPEGLVELHQELSGRLTALSEAADVARLEQRVV